MSDGIERMTTTQEHVLPAAGMFSCPVCFGPLLYAPADNRYDCSSCDTSVWGWGGLAKTKAYEFSAEEVQELLGSLAVTANKWRRSLENENNAGMTEDDRQELARRLSVVQGVRAKLGATNIKQGECI